MSRGRIFLIACFALILSACGSPLKFQKPDVMGSISVVTDTPFLGSVSTAVRDAVKIYDTEVVPPIQKLHEVNEKLSMFLSTFTGCGEFREPLTQGLRATDRWIISLKKADAVIQLSNPSTPKEKAVVAAGRTFIREMKVYAAQFLPLLQDSDAFNRSCDERNMSQLRDENEDSFNHGALKAAETVKRVAEARSQFLEALKQN